MSHGEIIPVEPILATIRLILTAIAYGIKVQKKCARGGSACEINIINNKTQTQKRNRLIMSSKNKTKSHLQLGEMPWNEVTEQHVAKENHNMQSENKL